MQQCGYISIEKVCNLKMHMKTVKKEFDNRIDEEIEKDSGNVGNYAVNCGGGIEIGATIFDAHCTTVAELLVGPS